MTPCTPRHRVHCSQDHAWLVATYRDARDAHDSYAGTNHQLEAPEVQGLPGAVTFKSWLIANKGRNHS